jgi:hypothetical protein
VHRDFLLKTGLKNDFGPLEPDQSVAKSNRVYAVSSYIAGLGINPVRVYWT